MKEAEQVEKTAMDGEKMADDGEVIVIPDSENSGKITEKTMEVELIKEAECQPPSPMMMVSYFICIIFSQFLLV